MWSDSMPVFFISSVKLKISLIQYLLVDSGFNFSSNHFANGKLYVSDADKIGRIHSLSLCVLGRPYRCASLELLGKSWSADRAIRNRYFESAVSIQKIVADFVRKGKQAPDRKHTMRCIFISM